ncbi:hypothetical protein [Candidatus Rhabdochlamydia porcellionis]|uniref:SSD domain-containing protein n=1 Tax=Candidatus Rhabdochlamydia porcellionis TaxID=225148 RepID=A0ABX8Z008_9BACT|nr:hypothetical protein [Candidatus Rhabdochlamydia porcellionis]QZA59005.1 hypothetical protein RHAB15C_0000889 [Candidatus Rhabdochlamydia porcellionis]
MKKLLFVFVVLWCCGFGLLLCRSMGLQTQDWLMLNWNFLPFFAIGILGLSLGVLLIRLYHDEIKEGKINYRKTFSLSKRVMVEIAYLGMPLIIGYLILWTILGLFYLIKALPKIGWALGVFLSFGPFLLFLSMIFLIVLFLILFFFLTPIVALRQCLPKEWIKYMLNRISHSLLTNFVLFIISAIPVGCILGLLMISLNMTHAFYFSSANPLDLVLIMLPIAVLLAPGVIFFFQFAAESHILMMQKR